MKLGAVLMLPLSLAVAVSATQMADARVAPPAAAMAGDIEHALHGQGEWPGASERLGVAIQGAVVESRSATTRVTLGLPGSPTTARQVGEFTLGATRGRGFRTAVQDSGDGSFRALLHVTSAQAPREYRFAFAPGLRPALREDGGVAIRDVRGVLVGVFAPPWARDARGSTLGKRYRVDGSAVTQIIDFTPRTSFPVVADPWWIPVLILGRVLLGVITRHAARQAAARGVSQAMIRQVIKNGARSRGNNGTTIYTQGKGTKRIRVIVDNSSGNVITVTKG